MNKNRTKNNMTQITHKKTNKDYKKNTNHLPSHPILPLNTYTNIHTQRNTYKNIQEI